MTKTFFRFLLLLTASAAVVSCSDDCDPQPEPSYREAFQCMLSEIVGDDDSSGIGLVSPARASIYIYTKTDGVTLTDPNSALLFRDAFTTVETLSGNGPICFTNESSEMILLGMEYQSGSVIGWPANYIFHTVQLLAEEGAFDIRFKFHQPINDQYFVTPVYRLEMWKTTETEWDAKMTLIE